MIDGAGDDPGARRAQLSLRFRAARRADEIARARRPARPCSSRIGPTTSSAPCVRLDAFRRPLLYVSARRSMARSSACSTKRRRRCGFTSSSRPTAGGCCSSSALLYLGFALILILAAIWLGLWFAERLSRPVGRLAGAARARSGRAILTSRCPRSRATTRSPCSAALFNQMTRQLKGQREALIEGQRRDRGAPPAAVRFGAVAVSPRG